MKNYKIGVIVRLDKVLEHGANIITDLGFNTCQLCCYDRELFTEENAKKVKEILANKVEIDSLWVGWEGPKIWDFIDGPVTLGLVPPAYRAPRTKTILCGIDFANMLGVSDVITHLGFMPENPSTYEYRDMVGVVKHIGDYAKKYNIFFDFETGQETPITLMRLIRDTGCDNLGINLDPANLLLYGKANPIDAVGIFQSYVRGVHIKDGEYPTDPSILGKERAVGEGLVNFPVFIPKVISYGFNRAFIIEREIEGEKQIEDIHKAKKLVMEILEGMN